jgi:hypothetical protein
MLKLPSFSFTLSARKIIYSHHFIYRRLALGSEAAPETLEGNHFRGNRAIASGLRASADAGSCRLGFSH